MENIIFSPFQYQKPNKEFCEDALPVADKRYSIICDGLGGSGSTKCLGTDDSGDQMTRTSAYWGARIVSKRVREYFDAEYENLKTRMSETDGTSVLSLENNINATRNANDSGSNVQSASTGIETLKNFAAGLRNKIAEALEAKRVEWGVEPPRSRALKLFPTTLASAVYIPMEGRLRICAIWAGDSRVYILNPSKGLMQLTKDDTESNPESMLSGSSMNNCISVDTDFYLNYAIYDLDIAEPRIIFCCSDGCFDYMRSPLAFEWGLLHRILDRNANQSSNSIGDEFAVCVSGIYDAMGIGDDTSMAGVYVGTTDSTMADLQTLCRTRTKTFDAQAVDMKNCQEELKQAEAERDAALKSRRLLESKVTRSIHDVFRAALKSGGSTEIIDFLKSLPFYAQFYRKKAEIQNRERVERENEIERLENEIECLENEYGRLQKICLNMFFIDYFCYQQYLKKNNLYLHPIERFKKSKLRKTKQYVRRLKNILNHDDFSSVLFNSEYDQNWNQVKSEFERYLNLMENLAEREDERFSDLVSQAYYHDEANNANSGLESFLSLLKDAIKNPRKYPYVSRLTWNKIDFWREKTNELYKLREESANNGRRSQSPSHGAKTDEKYTEILIALYNQNQNAVMDALFQKPPEYLKKMFASASIDTEKLDAYLLARAKIETIVNETLPAAKRKVDEIWDAYRGNYQLFNYIGEADKGVVSCSLSTDTHLMKNSGNPSVETGNA